MISQKAVEEALERDRQGVSAVTIFYDEAGRPWYLKERLLNPVARPFGDTGLFVTSEETVQIDGRRC